MEADETRELIAETVEKAEEGSAQERAFRNRVAALVGIFAVLLAIVHMASAGAARETLTGNIRASDTFAYMQAKILRETILKTAAEAPGVSVERRAALSADAAKLRASWQVGPRHRPVAGGGRAAAGGRAHGRGQGRGLRGGRDRAAGGDRAVVHRAHRPLARAGGGRKRAGSRRGRVRAGGDGRYGASRLNIRKIFFARMTSALGSAKA